MDICCELGGGFAVAGQHALGIELATADQDHGAKPARLTAGSAGDLLSPGGGVGIAVLGEFNGAVDVGSSAAPIGVDVFAVAGQAGFIGEKLLFEQRVKAGILAGGGEGVGFLRLRTKGGRDGKEREERGNDEERQAGVLGGGIRRLGMKIRLRAADVPELVGD